MGFGTLGPLARFAADAGFSPVSFAVWRSISSVVALIVILAVGVAVGRMRTTALGAISRLEWGQLLAMGLFDAGTTLGLFFAFERTSIAVALMVFYTFPIIVAVAAVPVYGERLGTRRIGAIAMASIGLLLLLVAPTEGDAAGIDAAGVLFEFVASLFQVGFALVGARGFSSVPALQSATITRGFSLLAYPLVVLPLLLLLDEGGTLVQPLDTPQAWLLILIAGITGAALPTLLLISGYRRVGPTRGAVLMLVEPLTGVFLAALLLAEQPTPLQLLGGLLVLTGAALAQMTPAGRPRATATPAAE